MNLDLPIGVVRGEVVLRCPRCHGGATTFLDMRSVFVDGTPPQLRLRLDSAPVEHDCYDPQAMA